MKISVFGLGYVGTVTAACLASLGHKVVGVDVNAAKTEMVNRGSSPLIEPGLDALIHRGVVAGNLTATQDVLAATRHGDILLICVGTPSDGNGNLNFEFVDRVCAQIAGALAKVEPFKVITFRSTLLPGTLQYRLIPLLEHESGKRLGRDFGVVVNPEFLREGSAIEDFMSPPFTIIGELDGREGQLLAELYHGIAAPMFHVEPDTASMVKYTSNAFHALKVSFTNEIGQLCKAIDVDGKAVMEIFCKDTRLNISKSYLRPGFAFGGSCLPKDLRALLYLARHSDVQVPVIQAILPSNALQIQNAVDMILQSRRQAVGVIGLTFKSGTDDLRESPVVQLVETLSGKGLKVRIYDENVNLSRLVGGNKSFIDAVIPHLSTLMCSSIEEVIEGSDAVVITQAGHAIAERLPDLLRPEQLVLDFEGVTSARYVIQVEREQQRPDVKEELVVAH